MNVDTEIHSFKDVDGLWCLALNQARSASGLLSALADRLAQDAEMMPGVKKC